MPVSDDQKLAMWREVLKLCRVRRGENVAVLTGETSLPANIDMAMRAAVATGAKVCRIDVPPGDAGGSFGQRADVGVTPLTGHRIVVDTLKRVDMVLDLMGLLHSPEQLEILNAGTRMLLVVEPPDMLARMIPSADDKRRVQAAQKRLKAAKTMTVTSKAGTDLTMPIGQFPTLAQWGYSDEPGHWDHWPSGFVATWPNEGASAGRLVIDAGDILLPFKFYVQSKIELDIRDGMITRIDGGFDAKYLRKHLESYNDPAAFGIAHVGWGLHPKADLGRARPARQGAVLRHGRALVRRQFLVLDRTERRSRRLEPFAVSRGYSDGRLLAVARRRADDCRRRAGRARSAAFGLMAARDLSCPAQAGHPVIV